jgi:hypothetical protein
VKKKDIPEWAKALANDSARAAIKRPASAVDGEAGAGASAKPAADGKRRQSGAADDDKARAGQ